jgi:hypothetical protein
VASTPPERMLEALHFLVGGAAGPEEGQRRLLIMEAMRDPLKVWHWLQRRGAVVRRGRFDPPAYGAGGGWVGHDLVNARWRWPRELGDNSACRRGSCLVSRGSARPHPPPARGRVRRDAGFFVEASAFR